MIILHITDVLKAKGNGVAVAVNDYIKYESEYCKIGLFNLNDKIENTYCETFSLEDASKIEKLPEPFCKPDLVVFNEVYKPKYLKLYKECLRRNIKYIIIPHGCLVNESQKKHRLKKILGNILLFNRFISKASAVQFLNENERKNSKFKYKKSIIAGNGVNTPSYKNKNNNKNKDFVFIGRYEILHKGLDLLVKICEENHNWFIENGIKIQLYGRDSGNELVLLKEMIKNNNVEDILIVNGPVYEKDKEEVLKNAYSFIQCSRFEGQPMGVIEALSIGIPCVVTYGTYLGEYIKNNKCGIACDFDSNTVFNAIKSIANNPKMRNRYAENAYKKSNIDFNWNTVIEKTIDEYEKI